MVDFAADVQAHRFVFFGLAIVTTFFALCSWAAELTIGPELSLLFFWVTLCFALAAGLLWVIIMDWVLTPFCPRCGAEMQGVRTVMTKKRTSGGPWLKATVHHVCKKCGYRMTKQHHVIRHVRDLHRRQGISRYWRFR